MLHTSADPLKVFDDASDHPADSCNDSDVPPTHSLLPHGAESYRRDSSTTPDEA